LIYGNLSLTKGGDLMAKIEEELAFAKQAKAAIGGRLTDQAIQLLREATRIAIEQVVFSGEGPLRDARNNIGFLLPPVTEAPEGQPKQDDIDDAKSAIEFWIEELEASL
jgi:hypothetical protein